MELLAAVTLLGILAGTLYAGLTSMLKLYAAVAEVTELHRCAFVLSEALNHDVTNALFAISGDDIEDTSLLAMRTYVIEHDSNGNSYLRAARVAYRAEGSDEEFERLLRIAEYADGTVDTSVFRLPSHYQARLALETETVAPGGPQVEPNDRPRRGGYFGFSLRILKGRRDDEQANVVFERFFWSRRFGVESVR